MAMIKRLIVIVICTLVFVSSLPEITIAAQTSTTTTENDVNSQNQETIVQDVDTSDTELTEAYEDTVDDSTVSDNEKNVRESTDEFGLLSEPIQEESDNDEEAVPKTEDVPVEGNTNDTEHSKKSSPVKNSGKHFQDEKGHETQGENIVENESTEKKKDKHADIGTEFVTDTASEEEVTSPLLNSEEGYIRVTLDANGGYFDIIDDQGDYVEESETMSYLIKEGECLQYQSIHHNNADYYLASWSLERNGEPIEDIEYYVPEEDITLYAVWGIYNVVYFDANGGVFPEDYAYETNDERTVAALKTVPGNIRLPDRIPYYEDGTKRISGWSEQRGGAPVIKQSKERQYKRIGDLEFIDGLVLYAVWENPIKVTLDANGGFFEGEYDYETNQFAHKITIEEYGVPGEEYPLPTPFNDDKNLIFARWNDDRDGNGKTTISSDIESFNVSESCTLYAIWEEPVVVTFDLNGGHCSEEVYDEVLEEWVEDATVFQKRVSPGDDVDISVDETKPVYKDKTNIFAGWSMTKGGYPINSDWFYPEESCTLYAIWKTPCDVTFDLNGGHCTEDVYDDSLDEWIEDAEIFHKIIPLGGCVAVGTSGYGPEYNDSSLAFAGWSLTKGGDLLEELFYYYPDSSCTLYAVWKEPFEVTFDANGGVFDGELYDDVLQQYVRNVSSVIKRIDPTDSLWLGTYKDGTKIGDEKTTLSCSEEELIFAGWSQSKGGEPKSGPPAPLVVCVSPSGALL